MSQGTDPQDLYARWLEWGTRVAFVFAIVSLALYFSGVLAPVVPLEQLPALWRLPAAEFVRQANAPAGWSWLSLAGRGDYLNLLAIAVFALLGLLCTVRVIPAFLRAGERIHAVLAILQAAVLLAAALGLFPGAR